MNEPGETVESIFCEIKDTCTTQEGGQLQDGSGEDVEILLAKKLKMPTKRQFLLKERGRPFVSEMTKETVDAAT